MSPRKTRRGAKSEGVNTTLSETISKKEMADSPSEKQQKTRAGRRVTKASSLESDGDHSPVMNKSKRRTTQSVQETPSKATRSRKKLPLDSTVIEEAEIIALNDTKTRRTRRKKDNETATDQTLLLDSTTLDESTSRATKSRGARARKKTAKKADPKSSDEEATTATAAPTRRRINASAAENVTILDTAIDSTTNDDGTPMSDEDTEVLQVSTRISRLKAAAAAAATAASAAASPAPGNRRSRKRRLEDFTPESSPITVNLTPHRTTKTPRKSPMNLGSPKSHADAPLRLAKTPRKLPVVVESPVPSEMSVTSSTRSTPEKREDASPTKLDDSPRKPRKSPKSSPSKSPRRSPDKPPQAVRKFSKSPKIVLRSPKPKSPKSKSPRVTATKVRRTSVPKRSLKSPRTSKITSPTRSSPGSPRRSSAARSPEKTGELASPGRTKKAPGSAQSSPSVMSLQLARVDSPKSPRETKQQQLDSPTTDHPAIQLPTVTLNKISPSAIGHVETATRSSARRTPVDSAKSTTPVRSPSAEKRSSQGGESPHRGKSATKKKRSAITDSGTPLRPIDSPLSAVKMTAAKSIIISSSNTPVDVGRTKADGMLSSTPRERIRRSLNLSPGLGTTTDVSSPVNGEIPAGSSTMIFEGRSKRRSFRLDDVSNPLISEDDESMSPEVAASRLDGTFEVTKGKDATITAENEQEKSANGTYDLAEPKTPNLRRKAAKRSLGDVDDGVEEQRAVKRTCRVRFASPTSNGEADKTIGAIVSGRSRSATPGYRAGAAARTPQTPGSSRLTASRRRSNSMSGGASLLKTPVAANRRSSSVSDAGARSASRTAQNVSVNRLSKPRLSVSSAKKPEVKTPVARKAPNFAQIHQKKFSQMESLVDAKKRVEKRHIAMSSKIPTNMLRANSKVPVKPAASSQPVAPVVAVNGAYNRYGFKLRKDDATKIVAQKQPTRNSEKKTNENRQLLKGVRTNRRFDLIMKARNINV